MFTALDVEPFPVPAVTPNLVIGMDSHTGLPHNDADDGRVQVSLLYYVHRVPRAFRGGDLEFFASDPSSANGDDAAPVGRIEHEDNLLVAFPSETFHGITDVHCDTDDVADGRFAAIAFLRPG